MTLNSTNISILKRLLVGRNSRPLRTILSKIPAVDLATLLSSLNGQEVRALIEALISLDKATDMLMVLPDTKLPEILHELTDSQISDILRNASDSQCGHILYATEEARRGALIEEFEQTQQQRLRQILAYPEDSAGRMMSTDVFTLPLTISAEEGLLRLRNQAQRESIFYIYVIDDERRLNGVVSLRALAIADPETPLAMLVQTDVISVKPESDAEDAADIVSRYDFVALPVVDNMSRLLGIITVDDVMDILEDRATADIYASAGLQEDDRVYSPARFSIENRLPWMFLNLIMAAMASSVVSLFEHTMSQLIILASLKNIVAGIGGNTAIQTLTVVTRGLATGDFDFTKYSKAVIKEAIVGLTVGLVMGICAGIMVWIWKGSFLVGCVISIAMLLNSLVAATFGAIVPILLKKWGRDPAIGSGVLVTMITDIFGFFSFLGIATLGLMLFGPTA